MEYALQKGIHMCQGICWSCWEPSLVIGKCVPCCLFTWSGKSQLSPRPSHNELIKPIYGNGHFKRASLCANVPVDRVVSQSRWLCSPYLVDCSLEVAIASCRWPQAKMSWSSQPNGVHTSKEHPNIPVESNVSHCWWIHSAYPVDYQFGVP